MHYYEISVGLSQAHSVRSVLDRGGGTTRKDESSDLSLVAGSPARQEVSASRAPVHGVPARETALCCASAQSPVLTRQGPNSSVSSRIVTAARNARWSTAGRAAIMPLVPAGGKSTNSSLPARTRHTCFFSNSGGRETMTPNRVPRTSCWNSQCSQGEHHGV